LHANPVRPPIGAGSLYPEDPGELAARVDGLLRDARTHLEPDRKLSALACPHGAYAQSGAVTAEAFACLKGRKFSTVVFVGPDHFVGFEGIAVYPDGAFRTPLGEVAVDPDLAQFFLDASESVIAAPEAHAQEHAIEVQLPFLQRILPDAAIVPILMGFRSRSNVEALAMILSRALDDPSVLLVATTDLSHYHPRAKARQLDGRVRDLVQAFAPTILWEDLREGRVEACGGDSLVAVMLGAGIAGAESCRILGYCDSGEATGSDQSVVGYLSAAFMRGAPPRGSVFHAYEHKEILIEAEETV